MYMYIYIYVLYISFNPPFPMSPGVEPITTARDRTCLGAWRVAHRIAAEWEHLGALFHESQELYFRTVQT